MNLKYSDSYQNEIEEIFYLNYGDTLPNIIGAVKLGVRAAIEEDDPEVPRNVMIAAVSQ